MDGIRNKINSIALIHEHLLKSEQINEVNIAAYLGKLIAEIHIAMISEKLDLRIESDIAPEILGLDTAMNCGLIINELLTNAIKHSFGNRKAGITKIRFGRINDHYELSIGDNGTGLPENIDPFRPASFGFKMVDVFVKQLSGQWQVIRDNGTVFKIIFSTNTIHTITNGKD